MAGFIIFFLVSVLGFGCGDEAKDADTVASLLPPGNVIEVRDGDYNVGAPPPASSAADAGAPTSAAGATEIVTLTGPASVTNGGTATLHVTVSPPPAAPPTFVVWHSGDEGYHSIVGSDPEADGVYDIGVKVAAAASQTSLLLNVAVLDASGNTGPARSIEIALVASGTGDVKVTLSFDRVHDLDLHVVEPNGDEIYYQQPTTESGGRIDLDSGAHCQPSAANGENIYWPPGGAPTGEYRVSVQNYEQCSPGEIRFTVTVEYDGVVETFDGAFADGTAGEAPSATNVKQVTTFRHER
jgi:hypothetical protein